MKREHGSHYPPVTSPALPLFLEPEIVAPVEAHSRRTDPEPSHEAAEQVTRRGRAAAQAAAIYALLLGHPEGLTADACDAALFADATYAVSSKRLPDLEKRGQVRRLDNSIRRTTRSGVFATVWVAQHDDSGAH